MHYLIQKMLLNDRHHDLLVKCLERMGLTYEMVRFMPFVHNIEFKTKRKDVMCFGSPNMGWAAAKYGWFPGSFINDNHDFEVQLAHYGDYMLNSDGCVMDFTDKLPEGLDLFFARPTMDSKIFPATVYTPDEWNKYVADAQENKATHYIADETRVVISSPKNIQQEIRCWVIDGKVVTASLYKMNGERKRLNYDDEWMPVDFANRMAKIFQPARAYVMDIALCDDEYKIIEVNLLNAAGFYEANLQKLIEALETSFGD
jgi:hypothetical protein